MTGVEIIAVVFAILILVKFVMIMFMKPDFVTKMMDAMYPKKAVMTVMLLVFAVVVGYYLLAELTIVQVFAGAVFGMFIYGLVLVQYPTELLTFSKTCLNNKRQAWLPFVVLLVLALWVLYAVYL